MNQQEVRDIFEASRQAFSDLKHLRERLCRIESISMSSGIPTAIHGGKSDPTATAGMALADFDGESREIEAAAISKINRVKTLCAGIRRGLGLIYGDILEDYYVRGLSWAQVAIVDNVSKPTALRLRNTAFDWVAFVGEDRAAKGIGRAEVDEVIENG